VEQQDHTGTTILYDDGDVQLHAEMGGEKYNVLCRGKEQARQEAEETAQQHIGEIELLLLVSMRESTETEEAQDQSEAEEKETKAECTKKQLLGTSRWTHDEHALFVSGMEQWPKNWKKIAEMVQTRTATQCRTHAQKVWKEEEEEEEGEGEDAAYRYQRASRGKFVPELPAKCCFGKQVKVSVRNNSEYTSTHFAASVANGMLQRIESHFHDQGAAPDWIYSDVDTHASKLFSAEKVDALKKQAEDEVEAMWDSVKEKVEKNKQDKEKKELVKEEKKLAKELLKQEKQQQAKKYRGVYFKKSTSKWVAQIEYDGKNHYLGCFEAEEEAARTYDRAARAHHGEKAHRFRMQLNFPTKKEQAAEEAKQRRRRS
jgi:SHAQKYF class myb-like DNA-binding protein